MKEKDINIKIEKFLLNARAVAVIINDNKVLFQKRKQDKFWALPGGKIRVGEKSKDAIKRELKEELEISKFDIINCNSISENFFSFNESKFHQYIFSYIVNVDSNEWIMNKEKEFYGVEKDEKLVFKWFDINNIKNEPIKPEFLKEQLSNLNEHETIFTSYEEK